MARAYLHLKMEWVRGLPRYRAIGIYSEQATGLTVFGEEFYAELLWADGDSYEEARKKVINQIKHNSWLNRIHDLFMMDPDQRDIDVKELKKEEEHPMNVALEHMGELP